jgi:hypothetical protein
MLEMNIDGNADDLISENGENGSQESDTRKVLKLVVPFETRLR